MTKKEMLDIMKENGWTHSLTIKDSKEDIKDAYEEMKEEFFDDSLLFPNGRDYDAEDEDGI